MTKEEEFVIEPLLKWFSKQRAQWKIYRPKHGTSATGWDIEARRKNNDLLIEAKFIDGPFLSSFTGLVTAPLANRPQHFMTQKYRSWCHNVCWAIGANYEKRNIYQICLDYFTRNPTFWRHYCEDLRLKYIFFVIDSKVTRVPFTQMVKMAVEYGRKTKGKKIGARRIVAATLMEKYKYE